MMAPAADFQKVSVRNGLAHLSELYDMESTL